MEFGRLECVDAVDFRLPPDDPGTKAVLTRLQGSGEQPRVHLGTPRWADPGYVGTLYPRGTPSRDYLRCYGEQFDTIELNTTFYRVEREDITRWLSLIHI